MISLFHISLQQQRNDEAPDVTYLKVATTSVLALYTSVRIDTEG